MSEMPARGPAPQPTSSFTKSGASGSFGRDILASAAAYLMTCGATGTRRTTSCSFCTVSPSRTFSSFTRRLDVTFLMIVSSSSAPGYLTMILKRKRSICASGSG